MKKIKTFFFVILFFLFFDLLFSQLFLLDLVTKNREISHREDIENRVFNEKYKYTFNKNKTFNSMYFGHHYVVHTNNLGFRDKAVRNLDSKKEYSILIGDSFVEGVTLNYEKTIVGILNSKIKKDIKSFEFLNAGVASYSSYIYLKKIKTVLTENPWLKINSIFVFLDKSDIHNDLEYLEEPNSFEVNPEWKYQNKRKLAFKKDLLELNLWRFYTKQTVSGLLIKIISDRLEFFFRDIRDRFILAQKLNKNFFEIPKNYTDALRSINDKRFYANYFYGENWNNTGKKSAQFSIKNLIKLNKFLENRNIKMVVVLYPWSYELVEAIPRENYLDFMTNSFEYKNIKYINLYDAFLKDNPYETISKNFIFNDIHYNSSGYKIIADNFSKKIKLKLN